MRNNSIVIRQAHQNRKAALQRTEILPHQVYHSYQTMSHSFQTESELIPNIHRDINPTTTVQGRPDPREPQLAGPLSVAARNPNAPQAAVSKQVACSRFVRSSNRNRQAEAR